MNETIIQINQANVIFNEALILLPNEAVFISRRVGGGTISVSTSFVMDGTDAVGHLDSGTGDLTVTVHCVDQGGSAFEVGRFNFAGGQYSVRVVYRAFPGPMISATIQATLV